ncbi:hypothetical protein [Rhodospirillum rubrum]|uniref:Lipoprotein n=1 Tax=Rhodospirillum rubrum (strain ATCC 11170 / ATH 1.1.1 / DSM 467 / LMG 4362 / NCIMB 8255 / S1) TaxID=269796 RepID=Q2RRS0_RHORT|nr:hypothetical protein [Rhodospirillum rubrum]ABC23175.1 hypothetical protein Rru_A2375 [Rhodospirillum rubrum ATCC 11170]AEO48906.1 hypothetical protein F11_12210 [Rhodospirillum rubrum F11]MBK5954815.1 hypothetical protein [Rhodospirillum rubrum]QXG79154.1 hypothetical protein KUL73_12280 [Rhodospirillum rubrum]HAP99452.1 hypothetical protein [Rhodospirillum rubrum]
MSRQFAGRAFMPLALGITLALTGACAKKSVLPAESAGGLARACSMVACQCINSDAGPFTRERPQPVVWSADGTAGCPTGWRLRRGS